MKQLITALSIVLVVAACSDSPTNKENERQYPYVTETWKVEDPENATWIGNNSNTKLKTSEDVDTLVIEKPGQHDLTLITDKTLTNGVNFFMADTAVNADSVAGTATKIGLPGNAFIGDSESNNHWGMDVKNLDGYLHIRFDLVYDCSQPDEDDIFLTLYEDKEQQHVFRVYRFKTKGFTDAVYDLAGC